MRICARGVEPSAAAPAGGAGCWPIGRRRPATPAAAGFALGLFLARCRERQDFGFDHAQLRLRAQLAAEEPHRFEVRVDVVGAAADEAGDEHALERRHVHLRLDGRFDRDLVEAGAAPPSASQRQDERLAIAAALRAVIDFFEEIVVLPDQQVLRVELDGLLVRLRAPRRSCPACS